MKYIILVIILVSTTSCSSKEKENMPSIALRMIDSITIFNTNQIQKGKLILMMYFSPDCEHCQSITQKIIENIDEFKNIQLYLITTDAFDRLIIYNYYYHIEKFKNLILAQDYHYDFYNFYKP